MELSKGAMIAIVVVAIIAVLVVIAAIFTIVPYNRLTRLEIETDRTWAEVNNQLLRRNDLIPNLVETVKGYATHERELFEHIADARARLAGATTIPEKISASNEMSGLLSRLLVVVENYPDLKANQNFLALQEELTSTENKISFSRQYYNDSVLRYNNKTQMFPSNVIAGMFTFKLGEFFEVTIAAEKEAPKVKFT